MRQFTNTDGASLVLIDKTSVLTGFLTSGNHPIQISWGIYKSPDSWGGGRTLFIFSPHK